MKLCILNLFSSKNRIAVKGLSDSYDVAPAGISQAFCFFHTNPIVTQIKRCECLWKEMHMTEARPKYKDNGSYCVDAKGTSQVLCSFDANPIVTQIERFECLWTEMHMAERRPK